MFKQARSRLAKWNEVLEKFLALDFTFVPTFTIYDANRDLIARSGMADCTRSTPGSRCGTTSRRSARTCSYWYLVDPERDRVEGELSPLDGVHQRVQEPRGRVCTGSDSGFIYRLRFGYIRELELLQEAGFHPLEVIRSATSQALPCAACRTSWARWRWASTPTCWCTTIIH